MKCPEKTYRLWCVALPRSVRSVCAPGCHNVQESAQEDPAESRHTDHRVDRKLLTVSSQRLSSIFCILSPHCPVPRLLLEIKIALPVTSWLTCAARLEDHSAPSPFQTPFAAECNCFYLKVFSCLLQLGAVLEQEPRTLWRVSAVRSESLERLGERREVGRFV